MEITRGKVPTAKKIVVYGPEGIGKSTFASQFPDPVFIDTEGSTNEMDVARFPAPTSWQMLLSEVQHVIDHPDCCRTLVLDTADWAEQLEIDDLLKQNQKNGIEDFGYGKGYTYSAERFGKLLDKLTEVTEKGIHVVITAHAQLRKVELPEEMGAYDHWEMKTSKKVAPLIREWASAVFFANYKVNVINIDNQGAAKGKNKAQGGRRVLHTNHTPFWDAKNRFGLPDELPFEFESIAQIIIGEAAPKKESKKTKAAKQEEAPVPAVQAAPEPVQEEPMPAKSESKPEETKAKEGPPDPDHGTGVKDPEEGTYMVPDPRVPKNLRDLMIKDHVTEWDVQGAVASLGVYTSDVEIWDYDPEFIDGCMVADWPGVLKKIQEVRAAEEIPF